MPSTVAAFKSLLLCASQSLGHENTPTPKSYKIQCPTRAVHTEYCRKLTAEEVSEVQLPHESEEQGPLGERGVHRYLVEPRSVTSD